MPKVHKLGSKRFFQITNFPFKWGKKFIVKGWTQEIEPPYRTSTPFIVRLPSYKALVIGTWSGVKTEEDALNSALQRRDVTYEDFTEEKGWVPAPDSHTEESLEDIYSRLDYVDGTGDVHNWQRNYGVAKE